MQYLTLPLFHYFLLRLYSVLRVEDAPALPSSNPTSTNATAPGSKSNIVPLAVGLTLGLLTLAIVVYFFGPWRKKPAQDEAPSEELKP